MVDRQVLSSSMTKTEGPLYKRLHIGLSLRPLHVAVVDPRSAAQGGRDWKSAAPDDSTPIGAAPNSVAIGTLSMRSVVPLRRKLTGRAAAQTNSRRVMRRQASSLPHTAKASPWCMTSNRIEATWPRKAST